MVNARSKGQRAERQAAKILQEVINEVYAGSGSGSAVIPQMERNLMQTMKGGYDLVGLEWLALEVKHQEKLSINDWWRQCVTQSKTSDGSFKEAVLMYKQNNVKWRIVMWGYLPIGDRKVRCPVDVDLESFLLWFKHRLIQEVGA